ncbi:MAG: ABC transporter permease, partial [SAR324 cluster bacterium]|nr:ABC transporter permease [SAR324 cluster bacterium]
EVGISMMVGGNIRGYTRNITTAIALETSKGEVALGLALGIVLLIVAFSINVLFHYFQQSSSLPHH